MYILALFAVGRGGGSGAAGIAIGVSVARAGT